MPCWLSGSGIKQAMTIVVLLFVAGQILVIVEFCRYGNLRSYLLKHKPNFNPSMDYVRTGNSSAVKLGHVSVDMQGIVNLNEI